MFFSGTTLESALVTHGPQSQWLTLEYKGFVSNRENDHYQREAKFLNRPTPL
jgi:hypothetical protein